jgi:hypothetical protein
LVADLDGPARGNDGLGSVIGQSRPAVASGNQFDKVSRTRTRRSRKLRRLAETRNAER